MTRVSTMGVARTLAVVAFSAMASGCAVDPAAEMVSHPGLTAVPTNPCEAGWSTLELGYTSTWDDRYATFATDGTGIWVTAKGYSHGGIFDSEVGEGHSTVHFGSALSPPETDEQTLIVANALLEARVFEEWWTWVELPLGSYWVEAGGGLEVEVRSCHEGGVTNGVPARTYPGLGGIWSPSDPCDPELATLLELGNPQLSSGTYATFSTVGSLLWVKASGLPPDGTVDPDQSEREVYLGPVSSPPTFDSSTGAVQNFRFSYPVEDEGWTSIDIPEGDYWLSASAVTDVVVQSCEPEGVANPIAVP